MRYFYKVSIWLDKHKTYIVFIMTLTSLVAGFSIYKLGYKLGILESISSVLDLFIDAVPDSIGEAKDKPSTFLYIVSIFAKITLFFAIIVWFIKSIIALLYRDRVAKKGNHILVIGLDSNSRFFIDSLLKKLKRIS